MSKCAIGVLLLLHIIWFPAYAVIFYVLPLIGSNWGYVAFVMFVIVWSWSFVWINHWHFLRDYWPEYKVTVRLTTFLGPFIIAALILLLYYPDVPLDSPLLN